MAFFDQLLKLFRRNPKPGSTKNIMLTGYWPPTNSMLQPFSTNTELNPEGWAGENWEGRGYDLHAFFPQFDSYPNDKLGFGDFSVDYQSTSSDFWRITEALHPCAIITFSLGRKDVWVIERLQRNLAEWRDDFRAPCQPTPAPPDDSIPADSVRTSSLPIEAIEQAINDAGIPNIAAGISSDGGGKFLSEYIAYHGVWYQAIHTRESSPRRCVAAGHIHVGKFPTLDARKAALITVRTVIETVNRILQPDGDEVGTLADTANVDVSARAPD